MGTSLPPPIAYLFHCKYCQEPIVLRSETIGRPFEPPTARTNHATSVAVPCPRCKRVGKHSALGTSPDYDPQWRAVVPDQTVKTEFLTWLECEGTPCYTPLPLASPVTASMTDAKREAEIASWIWDDLRCVCGEKVRTPSIRLEYPYSLKCPGCGEPSMPHTRDWFQVGKKMECDLCGKRFTLTEEHMRQLD